MQPPPPQPPISGYPRPNPLGPLHGQSIRFEAISEAWGFFTRDMASWIAAMLIMIFLTIAVGGGVLVAAHMIVYGTYFVADGSIDDPRYWAVQGIQMVGNSLSYVIYAGPFRMAARQVRGEPYSVADVFSGFSNPMHALVAGLIVGVSTTFGFLMCILPGLLLYGLYMFVQPLLVDQRVSALQAISMSWNALKGQIWMAMLFVVVVALLGAAGGLACGVGVLFSLPVFYLAIAIHYRDFFTPLPPTYGGYAGHGGYGAYPPPPGSYPPPPSDPPPSAPHS